MNKSLKAILFRCQLKNVQDIDNKMLWKTLVIFVALQMNDNDEHMSSQRSGESMNNFLNISICLSRLHPLIGDFFP